MLGEQAGGRKNDGIGMQEYESLATNMLVLMTSRMRGFLKQEPRGIMSLGTMS